MALTAPTLDARLDSSGHSQECLSLSLRYYEDLSEMIFAVAGATRQALETNSVCDQDVRLAGAAESLTALSCTDDFRRIILKISHLQEALRNSKLSAEDKQCIWRPIAQCYAEVQGVLAERIKPLNQRKPLKVDDVVILPVCFTRVMTRRQFLAEVKVPLFEYVLGGSYRSAISNLNFMDSYLDKLPFGSMSGKFDSAPESSGMLGGSFTIELPLKLVSAEIGCINIVEIPEGELEKALAKL